MQKIKHILVLFLLLQAAQQTLHAQCTGGITTFPYVQDFEANNGGWTSGGTASDWAWGTPSKTIITGAGSGNKCWITGGLTGATYNAGERSWIQSPCFDFTNLDYPQVSFLVFWETELLWDGATFQYSTNNGVSWQNVGAVGAPAFCLNANWFNSTPVNYLTGLTTVRDGWSGSVAGNCVTGSGSGGWKQASYSIPALAGQPGVQFRFAFGAGTSCNTYDGFAIDKFQIGTTQANQAIFTYNCTSSNTVQFTNASTPCPNVFQWNFNDPASGAANTSSVANPTHTFSGPGTYNVSLTVSDANGNNAPHTISHTVVIADVNLQLTNAIKCYGDNNAEITATVTGGAGPFTYSWNTTPVQNTAVATGLGPGNYTVTIGGTNVCPVQKSLGVIQPMKLGFSSSVVNEDCIAGNGSIQLNVTGGVPVYHYTWTPAGPDAALNPNLHAGFYNVVVTDANGCTEDSIGIEVKKNPNNLALTAVVVNEDCTAGNGSIQLNVTGGNPTYHYTWTPAGPDAALNPNLHSGTYSVQITDANGCTKDSLNIVVGKKPNNLALTATVVNEDCTAGNGSIQLNVTGGSPTYHYVWTPAGPDAALNPNLHSGTYSVQITDANGCTKDSLNIVVGKKPNTLALTAAVVGEDCTSGNGSIQLNVTGGSPTYHYVWTPAGPDAAVNPNLHSGTYSVQITDANGCTKDSLNIVVGKKPNTLAFTTTVVNTDCLASNGSIQINVSGGTAAYHYNWIPAAPDAALNTNLAPGFYNVQVIDANGCSKDSVGIEVKQKPSAITLSAVVKNEDCNSANGSIQLNVSNGTPAYHYTWTPAAPDNALNSNLATGVYSVHIVDANGCTKDSTGIEVKKNPNSLSLTAVVSNQICTAANGSIQLNVSGGTPTYHYVWTPAGPDAALNNNLTAGTYDVHITDANGCVKDSAGIKVIQKQQLLNVFLGRDTTICPGNTVVLSPGAYASYLWQNNSTASTFTVTQTGSYYVLLKDANGCMGSDAINVTVDCPDLFFPNAFSPNGDGNQDQFGPRGNAFNTAFYRLAIFNRWGQLIFESSNPLNKWDGHFKGQKQPIGAYVWRVDYLIPGQSLVTKNGFVVLMK